MNLMDELYNLILKKFKNEIENISLNRKSEEIIINFKFPSELNVLILHLYNEFKVEYELNTGETFIATINNINNLIKDIKEVLYQK